MKKYIIVVISSLFFSFFVLQQDKVVNAVPAAPAPTCEIVANVLEIKKTRTSFEDGLHPTKENFDFYIINLEVLEITTYNQEGSLLCDNSYIELAEQYKGYIVFLEEYNKSIILNGQKIRGKIKFGGDEAFRGFFLSDISVVKEKTEEIKETDYLEIEEINGINEKNHQENFILRIFNFIKSFFLRLFGK